MGSQFVEVDPVFPSGPGKIFKNKEPQLLWLQFVQGRVLKVLVNSEIPGWKSARDTNSIYALPQISEGMEDLPDEGIQYYPLLRGWADVPVRGDEVILCTFGNVNYYLGPLNSQNNPNYNETRFNPAYWRKFLDRFGDFREGGETSVREGTLAGMGKNFHKDSTVKRLSKPFMAAFEKMHGLDLHGDMVLEGRHGNSIRIGSRGSRISNNPYIMISNDRKESVESIVDGSIVAMTSIGKLRHYFPEFALADTIGKLSETGATTANAIKWATMNKNVNLDAKADDDPGKDGYAYVGNQLLLNSRRITLNAETDSMFLSSGKYLYLSGHEAVSIASNSHITIDSNFVFLGKGGSIFGEAYANVVHERAVKGDTLIELLTELIDSIGKIWSMPAAVPPIGSPAPEVMDTEKNGSPGWLKLVTLKSKLDTMLSTTVQIGD